MSLVISTLLIIFIAALIKGVLGFGEALIAMPLLTLTVGLQIATPLVGLMSGIMTVFMLVLYWRTIDLLSVWHFIASAALGIPVGLLVFKFVPAQIVTGALGLMLIFYGLYSLLQPAWTLPNAPYWSFVFGFAAGALGSAYNTGGPPLVIYATSRRWQPEQFRASLQSFFLPLSLMIIISHGVGGLLTPTVFALFVICLPIMLLAFGAAGLVSHFIPVERFGQLVRVMLVVLGAVLLVRT